MKISIALSVYNGEKYIIRQLDSIRDQSILINEVIIQDDCSIDSTFRLIEQYISKWHLINWKLERNKENLGWKRSFFECFKKCSGDIIFPCDQDDYWKNDKCKLMADIMLENKEINVLTSNYALRYDADAPHNSKYSKTYNLMKNDETLKKYEFTKKWPYILRPGCTYCFRKKFFDSIRCFWNTSMPHDAILWRYAIASDSLWNLNVETTFFYRHGDNASDRKNYTLKSRIEDIEYYEQVYEYIDKFAKRRNDKTKYKILEDGMIWLNKRKNMLQEHHLMIWPLMVVRYHSYYSTINGCLGDLYFMLKK